MMGRGKPAGDCFYQQEKSLPERYLKVGIRRRLLRKKLFAQADLTSLYLVYFSSSEIRYQSIFRKLYDQTNHPAISTTGSVC